LSTLNNRKMRDARSFFFWRTNYCVMNDGSSKPNASDWYCNANFRPTLTNLIFRLLRWGWHSLIPAYVLILRSPRSLYYYVTRVWFYKHNDVILPS
jgi:hypothetical protein